MKEIYILLGSNRGDRQVTIEKAKGLIASTCGTILAASSLYETEPWGFNDETPFINQVIEIESRLEAEELMAQLLAIEEKLGRIRSGNQMLDTGCRIQDAGYRMRNDESWIASEASMDPASGGNRLFIYERSEPYSSRTIDLDILFYGNKIIFTERLMIPHPRLHERRFTLEPLNEIAPTFQHPVLKKTISLLLQECTDTHKVVRIS
ncbi:MAG: 2-amino-4-hydroxy-6-hydroxymethyldihydropteridine diphosphokinase [bacterium]